MYRVVRKIGIHTVNRHNSDHARHDNLFESKVKNRKPKSDESDEFQRLDKVNKRLRHVCGRTKMRRNGSEQAPKIYPDKTISATKR